MVTDAKSPSQEPNEMSGKVPWASRAVESTSNVAPEPIVSAPGVAIVPTPCGPNVKRTFAARSAPPVRAAGVARRQPLLDVREGVQPFAPHR